MRMRTLSSIFLWLAAASASRAEVEIFQLRNGSVIAGPILKQTPSAYFVDLGYDVLTLPRDQVATHSTLRALPPLSANALHAPLRPPTASGSPAATTPSLRVSAPPPERFKSVNEMIRGVAGSIGVVSNPRGLGAGFLISPDGQLLTNFHVVDGEQFNEVTLFLKKGDRIERAKFNNVEVLASSALMDVALLKIPDKQLEGVELPALNFARDADTEVGSPVYAIGNPGMGGSILEHSVSEGIISSRQRNINDIVYIQTTAAVNPGNSGGPLLDASGRVIGLVTYKAVFQENIAFALPVYYIAHFLANEEAYAISKTHPNTGFRYLPPE